MKLKLLISTLIVLINFESYSITGSEALAKFQTRMYNIGKMTGIIQWTTGGKTFTGSFKFMAPGKIYIKFSNPSGKIVVSNGRKLWVYNPHSHICAVQDAGGLSGGIAGMTKGYFAIVSSQSSSGYTIKLKNNDRAYSEIILVTDSTFFLRKAIFKSKKGGTTAFTISNVSRSAAVLKTMFDFNVPASAQVVNNPLNIR
jgi:outer membrane lipoprotein carrier protein